MKPQRRDASRRVTPDLLDFYIKRAHALREEAFRDAGRAIAAWLASCRKRLFRLMRPVL